MAEQQEKRRSIRCDHGFDRSVVPCEACGDGRKPKTLATKQVRTPGSAHPGFVDMTGTTIAGVLIESRAENINGEAQWCCVCPPPCGKKFVTKGIVLREREKKGKTLTCGNCEKPKREDVPRKSRAGIPNPNLKTYPIPPEHAVTAPVRRLEPTPPPAPEQTVITEALRWWRLELDTKGAVKSCIAVEHRGGDGDVQFIYVLAHDQKEAGRRAWNEYTKQRERLKRARMVREGNCPWCCKKQDRAPGKRCTTCLKNERKREGNERKIARGEDAPTPTHAASRAERLSRQRSEQRLEVLREVHDVAKARPPREFFAWLDEQLGIEVRGVG